MPERARRSKGGNPHPDANRNGSGNDHVMATATHSMSAAREACRYIFLSAWSAKRAEPLRRFGDCLRAAWAFHKKAEAKARKLLARAKPVVGGRSLQLTPTLITNPTYAASSRKRYAGRAHWAAGRIATMGVFG